MPGKSIADLRMPPAEYRADRTTSRADGLLTFEKRKQACHEDMVRVCLLEKRASLLGKRNRKAARLLASKLASQAVGEDTYNSPASAMAARRTRLKLVGEVWKIADSAPRNQVATATLLKRGWCIAAESLADFDPRALLAQLRADIRRTGAFQAGGFLIAGLHADFEPYERRYQLHVHLLATDSAIEAVDRLRHMSRYRSSSSDDDDDHVRQRVRLSRTPLTNLPDPITYLFQPFWPSRWIGTSPEGESIRQRIKARIPEPYHSEWLLWMDRWRFDDLVLLMGARIGRRGLILSHERPCT
ncbi:hypothetical protein [Sphingomonas sp.]|uniref:hypothetical protein n=1 Tax=Sphingomonas sp. TaxID=28214 RepID=UPI0035C82B38